MSDLKATLESETDFQIDTVVSESAPDVQPSEEPKADDAEGAMEKEPASPEKDSAFQAIVAQLEVKAKDQKTPPLARGSRVGKAAIKDASRRKKNQTKAAAQLKPKNAREQKAKKTDLDELDLIQKQQTKFTVKGFMKKFGKTTAKLAKTLPAEKKDIGTSGADQKFNQEKDNAIKINKTQYVTQANDLRTLAAKDGAGSTKPPYELKTDPHGRTLKIKHADTAAPKSKTDAEISLDDKSRSLDDALLNHEVNGQTINIQEDSLAFPVSGEKTFDEAATAKREAQEEIKKVKPRYREEEGKVISESQADIQALVKTGLGDFNSLRRTRFKKVLGKQQSHEGEIETKRNDVLKEFNKIYTETKTTVNTKLEKLNGIEDEFGKIITEAEKEFDSYVRQNLKYINTPGFWDYSDWIDERGVRDAIEEKYKGLLAKKEKKSKKEIQRVSKDSKIRGWIAKSFSGLTQGLHDRYLYNLAVSATQKDYEITLFEDAKANFIGKVETGIFKKEKKVIVGLQDIAKKIVTALNAAQMAIQEGKIKTKKVLDTVIMGQYQNLETLVEDRQHEIISDMARTYRESVGKLKAKFETIRDDVLASWFNKAWNAVKAVVKAIIEFAGRIIQLLGRLAHLVGDIISSPLYFFKNLVTGISQGFSTFASRIDEFLITAFFDWLRGSSGMPIRIPKDWGPKGIFSLFTQLLQLSTETIWKRMESVYNKTIANAFRRGEVSCRKAWRFSESLRMKA